MQAVADAFGENVPAAQLVMTPFTEREPGGAAVHVALPSVPLPKVEPVPAGHVAHVDAPAEENVPAAHCTRVDAVAA